MVYRNCCSVLAVALSLLFIVSCEQAVESVDKDIVFQFRADLYAYYSFPGDANDYSDNVHDAVIFGATLTTGRAENLKSAYQFDGSDDYIILEDMSDFPVGNIERTIAGWFKSSVENPPPMMLFGFGSQAAGYSFQLGIGPGNTNNNVEFRVNGWGDSYDWRTGVEAEPYLDGEWHHCAITYDGSDTKVYLDGVLKSETDDFTFKTDSENMAFVIGREIDLAGWEWNGSLDDIAVFTRALKVDEVELLAGE